MDKDKVFSWLRHQFSRRYYLYDDVKRFIDNEQLMDEMMFDFLKSSRDVPKFKAIVKEFIESGEK